MNNTEYEFDAAHYREINQVRECWLNQILPLFPFRNQLVTALDLGCGAGHFSKALSDHGFSVTAMDLQESNLEVCRQRYPQVKFSRIDLDSEAPHGMYDLVLMFGILYHLQSPLQTLLRIGKVIGRVGIIETRVASGHQMACYLFNEKIGPAHNLARVTAVPTYPALVSMIKHAGFDHIYRPVFQPDHPQWHLGSNGQRHNLIISRDPLQVSEWPTVAAENFLEKWQPIP